MRDRECFRVVRVDYPHRTAFKALSEECFAVEKRRAERIEVVSRHLTQERADKIAGKLNQIERRKNIKK